MFSDGQFRVVSKGRAKAKLDKACFYFSFGGGGGGVGEAYLSFYVEKCPHVPKILVMGPINGLLLKRKKILCRAPPQVPRPSPLPRTPPRPIH